MKTIVNEASRLPGEAELLAGADLPERPAQWSRDGKYLLYWVDGPENRFDLWFLERKEGGGGLDSVAFLQTPFNEKSAKFSPDGGLVA